MALLPAESRAHGVLPFGLVSPTVGSVAGANYTSLSLDLNGITDSAALHSVNDPNAVQADARGFYRGQMPAIGASTVQLMLLAGQRQVGQIGAAIPRPILSRPDFAAVSVTYRPRFAFLKGL